ncbi:hypothetical protein [Pseudomonas syringae]|uniref:hypothetical protein n=1 Tax=Pseudomonas syringae TaxID=317 RepID=UPI0006E65A51|nr:hypothetical protein [Pseudomonas syringae]KPY47207.1 Uncharacterized protein ALO48_03428 [Pseudomonas syringae pv. rhaphiolepidis]KWS40880.1 hypothetical protein AL060_18280 [Pseudomonas syringae pv. rhaphiolepidis]
MLDLIYIVEERYASSPSGNAEASYKPNFTISGQDKPVLAEKSAYSGAAIAAASVATSVLAPFLPSSLLAGAVAAAVGAASIAAAKDRSASTEESSPAVPAVTEETRLVAAYVQHHSLSRSQAKDAGYRFQPGHPVVGKAYRRHPLSDYSTPDNGNLYIPSDSYDAILLEERESELIKLLVHLGATKISITKKASDKNQSAITAEASLQMGPMGGGDVSYAGKSERDTDTLNTREFSLTGRPWKADSKLDRESFFWLSYEPSWKAVVFAREVGGCLSASLEIKENTSFSTDKNFELSVKAKLAQVGAQAGLSTLETEENTYFVRAEFAPVSHSS